MTSVMAYADPWSVAPGETVRFMVSCIGSDRYTGQIVRLKQPEAGPLAAPLCQAANVNGVVGAAAAWARAVTTTGCSI